MKENFSERDIEIRKEFKTLFEETKRIQKELESRIQNNKSLITELSDPNSRYNSHTRIVRNFTIATLVLPVVSYFLLNYIKGFNVVVYFFLLFFYSLLLGFTFWLIRKKKRLLYGIVELFVGVMAIFIVLKSVNNSLEIFSWKIEKIMSLVGGIYILVRGIDNISITNFGKKIDDFFNFKLRK